MLHAEDADTICAVATPAGRGGVSIIRVSGSSAHEYCRILAGLVPDPGCFNTVTFRSRSGEQLDKGLVLAFCNPHSFTGEDVCEFHTHGSPVVTDRILEELVALGARLARPGEFSERAFRNDRIDLVQAEAIADLINSASNRAAQMALRSLAGEFSIQVHKLVEDLTRLRVYVEASLDFPDEEVEFLEQGRVIERTTALKDALAALRCRAHQGQVLQEGLKVVIAGEPNAGKSTLLNKLSGTDKAIVTDIPGTTRDILEASILINGVPVHLLDTAGLRLTNDPVESEGIRRAWHAVEEADRILFMIDVSNLVSLTETGSSWTRLMGSPHLKSKTSLVVSKIDKKPGHDHFALEPGVAVLEVSAITGDGISQLQTHLLDCAGVASLAEDGFIARRRHITALDLAQEELSKGLVHALESESELLAEQLRRSQNALGEITGKLSSDDLLGEIFSNFCIGK
jgi:tRNA modification GTPase